MDTVSVAAISKSSFVSPFADTGDTTRFGPTAQQAAHLFSAGNTGDILTRDPTTTTGAAWSPSIPPAQGGTGVVSYTIGDLLYASAATVLAKLPDVAVGAVLGSGGVGAAPAWSASPTIGPGLVTLLANASALALNIVGRVSDHAGYIQLFKNDGVTLEGGFRGATGLVAFFGPAGNDVFTVTNTGIACTGTVSGTDFTSSGANGYQVAAGAFLFWLGRATLNSPANSQLNLTNNLSTIGIGFDVGTDALLKVRTRAQTGDASISALLFQVMTAIVAAGGGAAPTFTTIGGGGPAVAAQNGWLKFTDSGGVACYCPVWK